MQFKGWKGEYGGLVDDVISWIERFYVEFRGQSDLWLRTRLVPRLCSEHTYLFQNVGNMLAEFVCVIFGEMAHDKEEWCWEVTTSNAAKAKW